MANNIRKILPAVLALLLTTTMALAAGGEPLAISLASHKMVAGSDGREQLVDADQASPGDTLEYVARYRNSGASPLSNVLAVVPIPQGMEYLPATDLPRAGEGSLDGATFAPLPLTRTVRLANGQERQIPVPFRDYRALRWDLGAIGPGEEKAVKVRARILFDPVSTPSR